MRRLLLLAAACAAMIVPAVAQTPPPSTRVAGLITSFDGHVLRLKTPEGTEAAVTIPPDLAIGAVAERKLSDIKSGDYVGSAALKGTDGKLHAIEVHIFTEAQRGTGEGHRPMGPPDQTMTNATVAEVAAPATAGVLRLKYKDGEQTILVGPEARVVAFIAGNRALLKPGASVRLFIIPGADGTPTARSVQAEKDGVKPL